MRLVLVGLGLLLLLPAQLYGRVVKWEGKPITVLISTDRLTRVELPETPRSVFLSRSDISIEKEDKSLEVQAGRARQVPAPDLMRSMMLGMPVDGYEIIKADDKEVYRDAFFSMKLVGGEF